MYTSSHGWVGEAILEGFNGGWVRETNCGLPACVVFLNLYFPMMFFEINN